MRTHAFRLGAVLFLALATTGALAGDCTGLLNCDNCASIDAISIHKCLNGGTCNAAYASSGDDVCICPPDTEGVECQTPGVTRCAGGSWCGNNGVCGTNFRCKCTVGFTGARCEESQPPDVCVIPDGHQCLNGGKCKNNTNTPCNCPPNVGGPSCEKVDVLVCPDGTYCENGGDCKCRSGSDCTCARNEGFIGATCGEVDREWFQARYNSGGSSSSKKEVVNVAAAVAVPLVLIIAAGGGFMAYMVHRERKGAPLFSRADEVPDVEMSARNALPAPAVAKA